MKHHENLLDLFLKGDLWLSQWPHNWILRRLTDFHFYLIGQRSETWPSLPDCKFPEVRTRSSWSVDTEAPPRADTNPRWMNTLNMHSRWDERNSRSPFWQRWESGSYAQRYMSAFNTQWGEGIAQIFLKTGDFKKSLCKSLFMGLQKFG